MADDPGWREAMRSAPLVVIPGMLQHRMRSGSSPLVVMRTVVLSFGLSLGLIGVVVAILTSTLERPPAMQTSAGAAVLAGVAIIASTGIAAVRRRRLDCSTSTTLARSYRARWFLQVAAAMSCALVGFAMFVTTDTWWLYAVAFAIAIGLLIVIAPTRKRLQAEAEVLRRFGCRQSLLAALSESSDR